MQIHRDDGKLSVNHSPRFDFSNRITETKNLKNQQFLPFLPLLFSSNRHHTNWVKALTSQAGLTNCMKCIWDQNMKWVTQQGRREEFLFHLLSPPQAQLSSAQLPAPHLPRSEAFNRAADDEDRPLLTAASACLRLAVEGERLLAVERSENFRTCPHSEPFTPYWELTLQVLHPESYFCLFEDKHKILFTLNRLDTISSSWDRHRIGRV